MDEITNLNLATIDNMTDTELSKFANEQAQLMTREANLVFSEITKYENDHSSLERVKINGFMENLLNFIHGGKDKDEKMVAALNKQFQEVYTNTGSIIKKVVELIEKTVQFTTSSVKMAEAIQVAFSNIMLNGIKDSNGNFIRLDKNGKKFVKYVHDQAELYVANQNKYSLKVSQLEEMIHEHVIIYKNQDRRIDEISGISNDNKIRLDQKDEIEHKMIKTMGERIAHEKKQDYEIELQKEKTEEHEIRLIASEKKNIEQDNVLRSQIEKDLEHDRLLEENAEKNKEQDEALENQKRKVVEHDRLLKEHAEKVEKQDDLMIKNLEHDEEQDRILENQQRKDEEHDRLLREHAEKDKKQDEIISKNLEHDEEQDRILENQQRKDEEHDRLLREHAEKDKKQDEIISKNLEHDEEQDKLILAHTEKDKEHDRLLAEISEYEKKQSEWIQRNTDRYEEQQKQLLLLQKSSNVKFAVVSIIAAVGVIMGIINIFIKL